jgi:hypothetical protein
MDRTVSQWDMEEPTTAGIAIPVRMRIGPAIPATTREKSPTNIVKKELGISATACAATQLGAKEVGRVEEVMIEPAPYRD